MPLKYLNNFQLELVKRKYYDSPHRKPVENLGLIGGKPSSCHNLENVYSEEEDLDEIIIYNEISAAK